MVYNPALTTVRESIISNIVTTLAAVNTPTYSMKINAARRWNGDDFDLNEFPAAIVLPSGESHEDGRLCLITSTMDIALHLVLRSADWSTEMHKLLADARVALTSDVTRGGKAVTTQILSDQIYDVSRTADPVCSALVEIRVLYRTLYEDPTTAF